MKDPVRKSTSIFQNNKPADKLCLVDLSGGS